MKKKGERFLKKNQKKAQVTLFILVGVLIVLVFIIYFAFTYQKPVVIEPPSKAPLNFIEQCISKTVQPSIDNVLKYGGLIKPTNYILKDSHEYNYLCFTDVYYEHCTNNYPMLQRISEEEIRKDSFNRVDECFNFLIEDYELQGYTVNKGQLDYKVEIVPKSVRLRINKNIVVSKENEVQTYDNFDLNIPSDLYYLLFYTREIVNQEAEHCYFESNGFMILYPKYNLSRVDYVESKIYELQNRQTKETFKFAIRSCPFAPGFINAPK